SDSGGRGFEAGPAVEGDRAVEADVAQQALVEAAQRFELVTARLRRGACVEHGLAHQVAEAKKEELHGGNVRARLSEKQYAALMRRISAHAAHCWDRATPWRSCS